MPGNGGDRAVLEGVVVAASLADIERETLARMLASNVVSLSCKDESNLVHTFAHL
jgi:hypothetical protein